jgi:pectinesterase
MKQSRAVVGAVGAAMRQSISAAMLLAGSALAWGQTSPARPTVTVASDGPGQFRTVQAAVDAAPAQGEVIQIAPGLYKEKLAIPRNKIDLRGMGKSPADVVLSWDDTHLSAGGTGKSASVTVTGDDFTATNLTIQNLWEETHARLQEGSQAVALFITGDREVLRHVRLLGYQDTLYAASKTCHSPEDAAQNTPCQASRMLFQDCSISGHVDFIFGDAKAVFDHCAIHAMAHPEVTITAQSKLYPKENSGYLFLDCTITAEPGISQLLLGRPWRAYSTVYFVNTKVAGTRLAPAGWAEWAGKLATSTYAEYNTTDAEGKPANTSGRIAGTRQLNRQEANKLTVKSWLADGDGWNFESTK